VLQTNIIDKEVFLQYQVKGAGEDSAEELQEFPREELDNGFRKSNPDRQQGTVISNTVQKRVLTAL
jgi:hypothetical protein